MSILDQIKQKMQATVEHLRSELKGIRTGRANPSMLDSFTVEVYGTQMRIKDVASVTAPEARQLMITPFDPQNAAVIGKSLEKANTGFLIVTEANIVRVKVPQMDESVRKEMVKQCHKKREECKISVRNIRRDFNDLIRKQKSDGLLAEDALKKLEKQIQDLTDTFCKEADEISEQKEKEIMHV